MNEEAEEVPDYGDDAETGAEHAEGMFAELHKLVEELVAADQSVVEAEEFLRQARWLSAELRERRIPALMERMGTSMIKHGNVEVEIQSKVHAGLPSADKDPVKRAEALQWFVEHGHGKLVKNQFEIPLAKGDIEGAEHLKELLSKEKLEFRENATIHPQTLLAWVREQLKKGGEVPLELLGVHEQRLAKIKIKD